MKRLSASIGIVLFSLVACEHAAPAPTEAAIVVDHSALEQFAVGAVYDAHPTRALVDKVEVLSADTTQKLIHVEMTGSPTARKIYRVSVTELDDGSLQLDQIETVQ